MPPFTPTVDRAADDLKMARSYFANMFERHDHSRFGRHSYGVLEQAIISLDSRFSVEASFFEVWRGLIDTPRRDWRFERVIFCLEDKDKKNRSGGFDRKNEYFVLPAEAMVNILSDEAPREAVMSFHFDNRIIELPDKEVYDDIKSCKFKKPSIKYIQDKTEEVPKGSYIVSLRISQISSTMWGVKKALDRMDANFQKTYNCLMELRSIHQSKIQERTIAGKEQKLEESDTTVDPPNQADSSKPDISSPTESNTSSRKSSPRSTDNTNMSKECSYCGRKTTPMWRRGPQGPGTLCNACGVKWRHGKILCDNNSTETAPSSPSTVTTENVDPLKPNTTRAKRKYTKSSEASQPAKKQQKRAAKKSMPTDLAHDEGSESVSSASSLGSPHSINLNALIIDEAHHALGVDAVEAATVLTLLKRS
ncbi:hypothetical protein PS15p_201355 [Mucor circinelloides]